ncbi:MAG: methylmalonyl-CoA mutase family protein [Bryobacterales bacterium]|nr:methylmalonyl-CoA mutase family protein [Bryobacterales bacterium]
MKPLYQGRPEPAPAAGEYPFTRGIHPGMYRDRLWTMRQYSGFGSAKQSNQRYRYLIERGTTGLSVAFDLPTQMGYDSDHPLALGEVGRAGVAISSLADMQALFEGIAPDQVSTSMTINSTAAILLALYSVAAERAGVPSRALRGTVQNDILKEYIARGTYIYPPQASMRIVTDLLAWTAEHVPRWNSISISGYHIREAGATAVQELAFTVANAIAYIEAARRAGLEVDRFAPRMSFFFSSDRNFLEEIAKFRAARCLYARVMRERFAARNPRSLQMRFHTQTAGSSLTAQQPHVNVVRTAFQALAAVLGGTQSLHTNALDEALALPSEQAATLALRTQQVIALESGVSREVDPLGGSYCIERLTEQLQEEAAAYIARIDGMGGMVAAIESGYVQREIHDSAYAFQQKVESGEQAVVGVNTFRSDEPAEVPLLQIDRSQEAGRREELAEYRSARDAAATASVLDRLRDQADGSGNLVPAIRDAVAAAATLGEISDALRDVFGTHE